MVTESTGDLNHSCYGVPIMLLIDLSGVAYHKIINFYVNEQEPSLEQVRRVLFTDLIEYEEQYGEMFGRMIICCDSKPYWRSLVQPAYKAPRLKARETSTINSDLFYEHLAILKQELIEYTNYVMIDTLGAEADDIIAVLAKLAHDKNEKTVIVSSDKDMIQLQTLYTGTFQFSPNRNKMLTLENTEYDLLSHILKGDTGDGIPNVFSVEGFFMIEGDKPRQRSITKKIIAEVRECYPDRIAECEVLDNDAKIRFVQNQELIDTRYTPYLLQETVTALYDAKMTQTKKHRIEELLSPFEAVDEEDTDFIDTEAVRL